MCGITGIYSSSGLDRERLEREIKRMTKAIAARGPDDEGFHVEPKMALGHRRLSIIDLSAGHQPIYNEDGTKCIVYNGEVFNYKELKEELIAKGHRFKTNGDTETILHAYEEWGEAGVGRLRGMFAFCIWDSVESKAVIVRDRLGIKPLFYAEYDDKIVFASEMKAILSDTRFARLVDKQAVASFFSFSYIPGRLTIYSGIRKLLPGHIMTIKDGRMEIKQYWDIRFEPDRKKKEADFVAESMELLAESVRLRLMSDVPLGAFLSGGVDSSAVVAFAASSTECASPLNTFTIGFGGTTGAFDDERTYARDVAKRYSTNHREFEVTPDVDGLIDELVTAFDEPFADDAMIPSYFISRLAAQSVKVALSGLGGDEAFCGYERYLGFHLSGVYNKIPGIIREKIIKGLIERLPEESGGGLSVTRLKRFIRSSSTDDAERYLGFITRLNPRYVDTLFMEKEGYAEALTHAKDPFIAYFNAENAVEPLNKVFYCDMKTYLSEDILACTDRLSMRHSLEVRVPFLDHKLIEYSATIPPEMKLKRLQKKYLLKKGVRPLLPESVIKHKKQGFVGPMAMWLKTDLKETTLRRLSTTNIERQGVLNPKTVDKILSDHYSGKENNESLIWSLIVFQSWFSTYVEGNAVQGVHS